MSRTPSLEGKRFGRLTVICKDDARKNKHDVYWLCKCDCGNEKTVTTGHLISGTVRSCGCLRKERAIRQFKEAAKQNITHGGAGTRLYWVWHCMVQRCSNPNNPAYRWYGAKGVRVCDEWKNFAEFSKWAHSNGFVDFIPETRGQQLSIDRTDSNGDYCPQNCRWITVSENSRRGSIARWENARKSNGISRAESAV